MYVKTPIAVRNSDTYFGFTNCPDICPNSLMKLSKALEKIRKMP